MSGVPIGVDAFIKQGAQLWDAPYGTALPGNLLTSDGRLNLEQQVVTLASGASGGTFTLSYDGDETGNIAYNANAATVLAALELLDSIIELGDDVVSVTGTGPWTISFAITPGETGNAHIKLLELDETNITGETGSGSVVRTRNYLGLTQGAFKIELDEGFEPIYVNESRGMVDDIAADEKVSLSGTLAEATLQRYYQASSKGTYLYTAPGGGSAGTEVLTFGDGADVGQRQIIAYGQNKAGYFKLWQFYKTRRTSTGPAFERGKQVLVPVKYQVLSDLTRSAGDRLFRVVNMVDAVAA